MIMYGIYLIIYFCPFLSPFSQNKLSIYSISHSYLADVTAAQLQRHLPIGKNRNDQKLVRKLMSSVYQWPPWSKFFLRPGHTAFYGLITAKPIKKWTPVNQTMLFTLMLSLKWATVDLLTWQDAGKIGTASDAAKSFELLKILARGQPRAAHVVKTCNTCETHMIIHVPAVIKTWGDAVRCETLVVCHGQSTVIRQVLSVGITGNSMRLATYHWQMFFAHTGHG